MKIQNKYFKILLIVIISYIVSNLVSNTIFLAYTPKINKNFITDSFNKANILIAKLYIKKTNSQNVTQIAVDDLSQTVYKQISQGIYAGEYNGIKVIKMKDGEVEWITMSLKTKSGKVVEFQYPKGNPPTQQMSDVIKSE